MLTTQTGAHTNMQEQIAPLLKQRHVGDMQDTTSRLNHEAEQHGKTQRLGHAERTATQDINQQHNEARLAPERLGKMSTPKDK